MEITYGELCFGVNEKYADEILVETSVDTTERGGVEKILSVEAEAKASAVELLEGEAEVSGKVNYRLLYLDRQSRLCGLDYFKDFKCRVKGDAVLPGGKCVATFLVPDADAVISGEEVELSAVVDVTLRYYGEQNVKAVSGITEAETLSKEAVTHRVNVKERSIELNKIADVGLGVKKIVLFGTEALPVEVKNEGGAFTASGEVKGTILYLNDADEVAELTVSLPYAEAVEEAFDLTARVKSARVILTDDEAGNVVEVEATLSLVGTSYEEVKQTVMAAACGEKSMVEEMREQKQSVRFVGRNCYKEGLSGNVALDASGVETLFVRPGCHAVAEVTVEDGSVKVEGVASFRVVYGAAEGYRSEKAEFPFAYVLPFAEAKDGMTANVKLTVTDASGILRGKEVAVTANAFLDVALFEKSVVEYLSEAKEGEPLPESEAGISVYFAERGEDAWSIAKSMGVLPSVLVKANPFLAEPIEEPRKILVFRQK